MIFWVKKEFEKEVEEMIKNHNDISGIISNMYQLVREGKAITLDQYGFSGKTTLWMHKMKELLELVEKDELIQLSIDL